VAICTRSWESKDGTLTRGWIFRFKLPFKNERDMGLGSLDSINLAKARELAAQYRELVATGLDPIKQRDLIYAERRAAEAVAPPPTFDECAADYLAAHRSSWRSVKHAGVVRYVEALCFAGHWQVAGQHNHHSDHILKILKPHWYEKNSTMKRCGAGSNRLDYAAAMKARTGDNPARWNGGNLKHLLAAPSKVAPVVHYDALNYKRMGEFMTQLRQREGIGALALEFTVLTAARTGEALGATWAEIDRDEKVWIVPASRMKAGREHRVPLSTAAMAVLHKAEKISKPVDAELLFSYQTEPRSDYRKTPCPRFWPA
jgi:hypothetical protein